MLKSNKPFIRVHIEGSNEEQHVSSILSKKKHVSARFNEKEHIGAVLAKQITFQCFIFDARRETFELGEIIGESKQTKTIE